MNPMKIAVASGKGGTGKTLVSGNLAYALSGLRKVTLLDCDVEEPNLHLFYPGDYDTQILKVKVPQIDYEKCNFCGKCGKFCRYGAITVLKEKIMFFEKICHSCGGCSIVCPEDAITEVDRRIGCINTYHPNENLTLYSGVLDEGEIMAPHIIRELKELTEEHELTLLDAPPGIACPVIETLEECDFCILVTEPTRFGMHDLKLAHGVTEKLGIPSGVVLNKDTGDFNETREYCLESGLPIMMSIPFDRKIAAVQNNGRLLSVEDHDWLLAFRELYIKVESMAGAEP